MKFDKSKVYTALNADELKIGSKCYFEDNIGTLKMFVEKDKFKHMGYLETVRGEFDEYRFESSKMKGYPYALAYLLDPEYGREWEEDHEE